MRGSLIFLSLSGCFIFGGGDDPDPTTTDEETVDSGDGGFVAPPDTTMRESRVVVGASFRYDASTGLPGDWSDDEGPGVSAIQIVVGDDQYTGATGSACVVEIPVTAEGARLITDLDDNEFWGVRLAYSADDVITNCDQPGFQRIWDFYSGEVVQFMTTNRDGTPAEFSILIEEPLPGTFTWINANRVEIEDADVIGATIGLSDRWAGGSSDEVLTIAHETDADGLVLLDEKMELIPIPLADVFQNPGLREGRYSLIGYSLAQFTN